MIPACLPTIPRIICLDKNTLARISNISKLGLLDYQNLGSASEQRALTRAKDGSIEVSPRTGSKFKFACQYSLFGAPYKLHLIHNIVFSILCLLLPKELLLDVAQEEQANHLGYTFCGHRFNWIW
jgi:hypothetical protein